VGTANFTRPDAALAVTAELVEHCRVQGLERAVDLIGALDV